MIALLLLTTCLVPQARTESRPQVDVAATPALKAYLEFIEKQTGRKVRR